jgi:transcriptional regulator with XRE-family HTH domain
MQTAPIPLSPRKPPSRLQTIRESRGLSRSELAQRSSVPLSSIYMLEDRMRDPRASTVQKLAIALNVSTDCLLGLVSPEPEQTPWQLYFFPNNNNTKGETSGT